MGALQPIEWGQQMNEMLERIQEIRHAETPGTYIKQRIAENAQRLSKVGELAARVEVINEALTGFTAMLYQADTDATFANIDNVTFRILVPAPFGSSGWKLWGLRAWEAGELRRFLMERCRMKDKRPALFDYNSESRTWHLNASDYPSFLHAGHYLQREPMTAKSLRIMSTQYRQDRIKLVTARNQAIGKV